MDYGFQTGLPQGGKSRVMLNLGRNTSALIWMVLFVTVTTPPLSSGSACGSLCQTWALCLSLGFSALLAPLALLALHIPPCVSFPAKNQCVRPRPTVLLTCGTALLLQALFHSKNTSNQMLDSCWKEPKTHMIWHSAARSSGAAQIHNNQIIHEGEN